MKSGTGLQQFCQQVKDKEDHAEDYLVDTRALRYEHTCDHLVMSSETSERSFNVHDHAHGQVAQKTGVPKKFYDRLRNNYPGVLEQTLNSIFANEPQKRLVRTYQGTTRAFLSDQYRRIDNFDILNAVLPILKQIDMNIISCNVGFEKMFIKATFPEVQEPVEVGDPAQAGIVISNSEVGAASARFEPMLYRLACKNGMTRKDKGIKQRHLGAKIGGTDDFIDISERTKRKEDEVVVSKMRDIIESLTSGKLFDKLITEAREAKGVEIETSPSKFVEKLGDDKDLTEDEQDSIVHEIARNEHDLTKWGAANAVSRYSQRVDSYLRASELEELSGEILSMSERQWNKFSQN